MPSNVAKNMVEDVLELDMNARLNMAGWLTTHREKEGEELICKALYINSVDAVEYPSAAKFANSCVHMLGNLWHAPEGFIGTDIVGSTEGVYLGILAAKKNWQKKRKEAGLPCDKPNMVYGANAQVAWHKGCSYFDIEPRQVWLQEGQLVIDPEQIAKLVDENTIGEPHPP